MTKTEPIYKQVGRRLREVRERLGLSQAEVGKRLGMTDVGYLNYEAGNRRIPISELRRVADFFGYPMGYFLGESISNEQLAAWQISSLNEDDQRLVRDLIELLRERRRRSAA